jgi:alkylation response protein AidB-like acyl-CoA dehydrogenase
MDLSLSELHEQVRDTLRELVRDRLTPGAAERDRAGELARGVLGELGDLGMLGVLVPEETGGAGLDMLALALAVEEVARGDASLACALAAHNALACAQVLASASAAQQAAWLPDLAAGSRLGAWTALDSAARQEGAGYVVEGTARWVVGGTGADLLVVVAPSPDGALGAFAVSGAAIAREPVERMGLCAAGHATLTLDGSAAERFSGGGPAPRPGDHVRAGFDIAVAAVGLGVGQAALDAAARYAQDRKQFGRPIARFQAIQYKLADMSTALEGARLLTHPAAALHDAGRRAARQAAGARLMAGRAALLAADEAIQIHGGYGYTREYPVERHWRDAKTLTLLDGTPADGRDTIAREVYAAAAR